MSMFAGGLCAGMERGHYVTLDLTTHFLARGQPGSPLDAHVELVKQTRGHAFLQGVVRQNDEPCYSFSGTLKRVNRPNAPRRMTGPVRAALRSAGQAADELKPDPAQARAVAALDRLAASIGNGGGLLRGCSADRATGRPASICGAASGAASRC